MNVIALIVIVFAGILLLAAIGVIVAVLVSNKHKD